MLKLLSAIEAKTEHRTHEPVLRNVTVDFEPQPPKFDARPEWWTWIISVRLWQATQGPESERAELLRNARRAIAHEIYGEIEQEIRLTLRDLWDDGMHKSKAAERLEKLVPLLRGED